MGGLKTAYLPRVCVIDCIGGSNESTLFRLRFPAARATVPFRPDGGVPLGGALVVRLGIPAWLLRPQRREDVLGDAGRLRALVHAMPDNGHGAAQLCGTFPATAATGMGAENRLAGARSERHARDAALRDRVRGRRGHTAFRLFRGWTMGRWCSACGRLAAFPP